MEEKKKKSVSTWPIVIMIMVALVLVATVLIIQMQGTTTTSGSFPEPQSTDSLTCTNNSEVLSILEPRNALSKSTKVVATFSRDKMESISVNYSLKYSTATDTRDSENVNHVKMNQSTQNAGLGPDIFNLHISNLSDGLEIRMFAEVDDITNVSAKYLMLEQANGSYSKSSVKNNYVSQGFNCS